MAIAFCVHPDEKRPREILTSSANLGLQDDGAGAGAFSFFGNLSAVDGEELGGLEEEDAGASSSVARVLLPRVPQPFFFPLKAS